MTQGATKIREVLITRGKVVARREQVVGTIRMHKPSSYTGTFPRILQISWVVISLGSSESQEQYAGVRLHMDGLGNLDREQECYLDIDEVREFIDGIDVVSSFRETLPESLAETRDVYYSSKENARIGIFKSADSSEVRPYLTLMANGTLYLFTGSDEGQSDDSSLIPASGDEYSPLRHLVDQAMQKLVQHT